MAQSPHCTKKQVWEGTHTHTHIEGMELNGKQIVQIIIATITQGTDNFKGLLPPLGLTPIPCSLLGKTEENNVETGSSWAHTAVATDHFVSWKVAHCTWPLRQKVPLFSSPYSSSRSEWLGLNLEGWHALTPMWLTSLCTRGIGGGEIQQKRTRWFVELGWYWVWLLKQRQRHKQNKTKHVEESERKGTPGD